MGRAKKCPSCGLTKSLAEFSWRDSARTKPQSYCLTCARDAWRRWYANERNRRHHLALVARRRRRRIDRNQKTIARLKDRPCADCGGHFPTFVMDFDHVRDKLSVVSTLVYSASTERLIAEATKCDVVCSNCHRMRTQRRLKNRQPKGGQRAPSETMPRASGLGQQPTQLEFTGDGM